MAKRDFFWLKNQGNRGKFYFVVLILCGIFFAAGFFLGANRVGDSSKLVNRQFTLRNSQPPENVEVDFSLFWDVWQRVTTQHLDRGKFDPQKLVEGAISGLIRATEDPYSAFLTPEKNAQVEQELQGIYEGVGIQIGAKNSRIVVIAPLLGTPAAAAGLKAGDTILKIDETSTLSLSLPEAVSLIRGPAGSTVKLTLQRGNGDQFEKELKRAKIQVKSVELSFEELSGSQVAIIELSRFGEGTNSEWDEAVGQILSSNPKGLILDLRNNPGGFLQSAVYVASEFGNGRIVGQEDSSGQQDFFQATRNGKLKRIPMVVLINGGTASAAEIVAGALQEKGRARLIGEQTFGKGTVQDVQELEGGAGLHLTVAKWLLPSGKDINGEGLKPDIESAEDEDVETDIQLDKAKEVLGGML